MITFLLWDKKRRIRKCTRRPLWNIKHVKKKKKQSQSSLKKTHHKDLIPKGPTLIRNWHSDHRQAQTVRLPFNSMSLAPSLTSSSSQALGSLQGNVPSDDSLTHLLWQCDLQWTVWKVNLIHVLGAVINLRAFRLRNPCHGRKTGLT